jgi:hypothetical protein
MPVHPRSSAVKNKAAEVNRECPLITANSQHGLSQGHPMMAMVILRPDGTQSSLYSPPRTTNGIALGIPAAIQICQFADSRVKLDYRLQGHDHGVSVRNLWCAGVKLPCAVFVVVTHMQNRLTLPEDLDRGKDGDVLRVRKWPGCVVWFHGNFDSALTPRPPAAPQADRWRRTTGLIRLGPMMPIVIRL